MPEYQGINLQVKPNSKQKMTLRDYINYFNGEIILDISDKNGNNISNIEYTEKTASSKILNDIENYFNK